MYTELNYDESLYHHGIKGQHWGIRRYQNYDGSLTQKGMKRYNASLEKYNDADEKYKAAKKAYKEGTGSKADVANKQLTRKEAKRKLDKDYKHLKQDKLADKGKVRYAKGQTITNGNKMLNNINVAASLAGVGTVYAYNHGLLNKKAMTYTLAGVAGADIIANGAGFVNEITRNKQLRAYYGHTSKY